MVRIAVEPAVQIAVDDAQAPGDALIDGLLVKLHTLDFGASLAVQEVHELSITGSQIQNSGPAGTIVAMTR